MAKTDRYRSPEEVERLNDMKRGINLVALATERYGFSITERPRDDQNIVLKNKTLGDTLNVNVGAEGWHVYENKNNPADRGSVVDFLQQRHPDRNLGQVKGMMQEMMPGARAALDNEKYLAQQVVKLPSAAEQRYESLPASERRTAMVRDTTGPKLELTDSSYLLERGLTKETVNDPIFKGRVFTDQHPDRQVRDGKPQHNVGFPFYNDKGIQSYELRNRAQEGGTETFKMMMKAPGDGFGAKNGVWSSNLLAGKGTQPDRMVLGESPIDMMSKYQVERAAADAAGKDLPNTRYVATGGTPSIEQKAIIQAIIDREQPKQVIMSNDNDPAGQAFNVRYLNDLRPPVAGLTPEQQTEAAAARERTTWIAGDNGKKGEEKLLTMTISFKTETAREGREAVENLRTQAEMRSLPSEEPAQPLTAGLEMRRNAPTITEVVLRVEPTQADELVDLARELRRAREVAMPEAARTPENYLVVEKANGKDYNQDILQARGEAQLEAARERAGFTTPAVAPQASPEVTAELDQFVNRPDVAQAIANAELQERAQLTRAYTSKELERINSDLVPVPEPGRLVDVLIEGRLSQPEARAFEAVGATIDYQPNENANWVTYPHDEPAVVARVSTLLDKLSAQASEYQDATGSGVGVVSTMVVDDTIEDERFRRVVTRDWQKQNPDVDLALRMETLVTTGQEAPTAAVAEREVAVVRVTDNEALPAGVAAPDDRFRSLAQEVRSALEETGVQVTVSPVPSDGPLVKNYLEFEFAPGSPEAVAAQQVLANAVGNAPDRIDVAGIEPAGDVQAAHRFHIGLPLAMTPVALATAENDNVLHARLAAAELPFAPTQVGQEPGYVVMLDSSNARDAALLEKIVALHEKESDTPLTVLQSDEARRVRQEGVAAYYDPERGNHETTPAIVGVAVVRDINPEDSVTERLSNVGATVNPLPQTEAERMDEAPKMLRVEYPLDDAAVTANVSRLLNTFEVTEETQVAREAREQLRVGQGEPRIDVEFLGRSSVIEQIAAEERQRDAGRQASLVPTGAEPTLDETKLGYPGLATAAVGYSSSRMQSYIEQMEEAGAHVIERPVSALAPENSVSFAYPLDQPEVVARISNVLDGINEEANQQAERLGALAGLLGPVGVFEHDGYRTTRQQAAEQFAEQFAAEQVATPQIAADIDNNGSTSAAEILAADTNRDGRVTSTELDNARFAAQEQAAGEGRNINGPIAADINNNGSTSAAEILAADTNRDGQVTSTELDNARFVANEAKERKEGEQNELTVAEKQAEILRRYEQQRQEALDQQQAGNSQNSNEVAQAEAQAINAVFKSAAIVIYDAEPLPAGTLAPESTTVLSLADKVQRAIEETGVEVSARQFREARTGEPATMISFNYPDETPAHARIQEVLRDARNQGVTKIFGIDPGEETQRQTEPITRSVALHEQPLAIALDAPSPLLESQLRATGAAVTNEPVQERPGLVVVVDTHKGEQLAGVEETLTRLPAAALVVEGPEAAEMRGKLTQDFREQGGTAPALEAEAILGGRQRGDVTEQLREAGATVAPVARPELPENAMSVRYPLDKPEVIAAVSVVLDGANNRSAQLAMDLGQLPGLPTGGVQETPLAQETRQVVAKEQGVGPQPDRTMPEQQDPIDRTIDRPKSTVIVDTEASQAAAPQVQVNHDPQAIGAAAASFPAARPINAEPEAHPVERRVILDTNPEKPDLATYLETVLNKAGFQVAVAPIEAVGEEKAGTRMEALYRTTDPAAVREKQAEVLRNIGKIDAADLTIREPEAQARERQEAVKAPTPIMGADDKPDKSRLVGAGQTLRANITVLEENDNRDRTTKIWTDLKNQGADVANPGKTDLGAEGVRYTFPVNYRPTDSRLPRLSATLDAAARSEGVQVTESDDMRLERLSRAVGKERNAVAKMSPAEREAHNSKPAPGEYRAAKPEVFEQLALTSDALKTPAGVKSLREELKETGAVVALQHLDGRPANAGTVQLSYLANSPKAEAIGEVLSAFTEKGGHVYDLKAGADLSERGKAPEVALEAAPGKALTVEQEREANLKELVTLEARRDALRESQREATVQSQLAEQQLQTPAVVAALAAAPEKEGAKPWVGFGPDLRGEDMRNTDAAGMDLRGANMAGLDLRSADLRESDLREANLTGVDLSGSNLTGVRLEGAVMDGAKLEKAFRIVENTEGRRQVEENLTIEGLTGPQRTPEPLMPVTEQTQASTVTEPMPAGLEQTGAAAQVVPQNTPLEAPQFAGLSLQTEAEMLHAQPAVTAGLAINPDGQVVTVTAEKDDKPGLNLPTQQEYTQLNLPIEPVAEMPSIAQSGQEPAVLQATAEAVGIKVPERLITDMNDLSPYEKLEEAGTYPRSAYIYVTQPVQTEEEAATAGAARPDRVKEVQDQLAAVGSEAEVVPGRTTLDEGGKTETTMLAVTYTYDDRNLPEVHKALLDVATVPEGSDYGVRVADPTGAERTATVEGRMENTPEAAKALAALLHDGDPAVARLLVQRPALEDVWALQEAGASVERIYLPDGPAAMVTYPTNEPGVTGEVSIELDRIQRNSELPRPPHNSNDREISGPLLGEDPEQQVRRQAVAEAEGLKMEPLARYEPMEMAERDARAKYYFQEEAARPSDTLTGKLADGQAWEGTLTDVLRLEKPEREALEASWKAEKTTLILVVQESPELRTGEPDQQREYPAKVAAALEQAGAETQVRGLGVSPDTGLDKHLIAVTFENSSPDLARIQATLNRLADQDGVQVPSDGYWQREAILGPNGSRLAEPVLAERDRPWLEAVVAIVEPTAQERRELTRAGARVEDAQFENMPDQKAVLVYYDLDNPATVARISPVLNKAEEEGRGFGEFPEAREARQGRVEQYQQDIRQEKQQSGEAWEQFAQRHPQPVAKQETEVAEAAMPLSFADRLRAAVNEQLAEFKRGYELGSESNQAIARAEQRGISDRLNGSQKQKEQEAYDRGFAGPGAGTTIESNVTIAGDKGSSAEISTDTKLRDRRDDERTQPVIMDAPKEGKVVEVTEHVKPATPATPDREIAAVEKAGPPVTPGAPEGAPAVVKAQERELQHGIIGMETTSKRTAEERMEMVRTALMTAGANVEQVVPSSRENKAATLNYSYDPQSENLEKINRVLANVERARPSMIQEEPHSLHHAGIKPNTHEIPQQYWPEREGQFSKAHIVVDDFDQTGSSRAERIKGDLVKEGAIVGEVKKDGHGHVEMDVSYHTHSPKIDGINSTLDKAGSSKGIEVQELDTDRSARYQGAIDQAQNKSKDKEREQGE